MTPAQQAIHDLANATQQVVTDIQGKLGPIYAKGIVSILKPHLDKAMQVLAPREEDPQDPDGDSDG